MINNHKIQAVILTLIGVSLVLWVFFSLRLRDLEAEIHSKLEVTPAEVKADVKSLRETLEQLIVERE